VDFVQAGFLVALALVATDWLKNLLPGDVDPRVTPVIAMAVGIGAVFLAAATVWAHDNLVGGVALDHLDGWSKIAAGIFLGAGAGLGDKVLNAVRSVGENAPPRPPTQ
jgi:hypothetical protein